MADPSAVTDEKIMTTGRCTLVKTKTEGPHASRRGPEQLEKALDYCLAMTGARLAASTRVRTCSGGYVDRLDFVQKYMLCLSNFGGARG